MFISYLNCLLFLEWSKAIKALYSLYFITLLYHYTLPLYFTTLLYHYTLPLYFTTLLYHFTLQL